MRKLNREVGANPTRSRRCNVEFVSIKPLDRFWEGETNEEAKSEELPVRYIVARPARDGERCRKLDTLCRVYYDISPFFNNPAPRGIRGWLKNGFLFLCS